MPVCDMELNLWTQCCNWQRNNRREIQPLLGLHDSATNAALPLA